uniref:NADH dehydrogenase subunit 4L n=1 Tax=Bombus waltoni TaxID=395577 RepID=A0A649WEB2_9HYME|nr:NADH dehydrogenase subunit 4L [Bombus waltoni]QGK86775.1 NADH dehydrogenase subunit 4L [Bombus waltoni]
MNFIIFNLIFMMLFVMFSLNVYYLSFLISVEFLIVTILFYMLLFNFNNWIFLIYLVFAVCEAVLGLSLLVSMNYEYGHQKIEFVNLLK